MIDGISIRETTLADVPEIVRHRRGMFDDMNMGDVASRDRMQPTSTTRSASHTARCK